LIAIAYEDHELTTKANSSFSYNNSSDPIRYTSKIQAQLQEKV